MRIDEVVRNVNLTKNEISRLFDIVANKRYGVNAYAIGAKKGISRFSNFIGSTIDDYKNKRNKQKSDRIEPVINEANQLSAIEYYDKMVYVWKQLGEPTDLNSLRWLLKKHFKLSDSDIRSAFNRLAKEDPEIEILAKQIVDNGLGQVVLDILRNPYKLSSMSDRYNKNIFKDGVQYNTSSLTEEDSSAGLSDKALRELFGLIATDSKSVGVELDNSTDEQNDGTLKDSITKLIAEFNAADDNIKPELVKQMATILSNNYKKTGWDEASKTVISTINDGKYNDAIAKIQKGQMVESKQFKVAKELMEKQVYGRARR